MVDIHHRGGTFSPSPAQNIVTATNYSRDGSPSINSPTSGSSSLAKIAIAQVYLLLSTIKEDKDRTKWELQAEQLRKLVHEHGMEVFPKYFTRLVVGNAPTIFPGINRPVANSGNYQLLAGEIRKIAHDVEQAGKIAESIETGNEELFRDFDLSTFMEHFKMDALEKTVLALAFKMRSRTELKTKADAILSANFQQFVAILSRPEAHPHNELTPDFVATLVDRFIQYHPPNFTDRAQSDLEASVHLRYATAEGEFAPTEVMSAMYLRDLLLGEAGLSTQIQRAGAAFTADEDTCTKHLRSMGNIRVDEEQVAAAVLYTSISRSPIFSPEVLVSCLRRIVPRTFRWAAVLVAFDKAHLRVTARQFLSLYKALLPVALAKTEDDFDMQILFGGRWQQTETQLSFITAFTSLSEAELQTSRLPGLRKSFSMDMYAGTDPSIVERARIALQHPLSSAACISAIFDIALISPAATDTMEAKRLFQTVIVSNLDVFVVSSFGGVPKPWSAVSIDTMGTLFDRFLWQNDAGHDFVLYSVWHQDKLFVQSRLEDAHSRSPLELGKLLEHAVKFSWLKELVLSKPNGFSMDLAALAHAHGVLDLNELKALHETYPQHFARILMTFLSIKADHELSAKDSGMLTSLTLPVRTISALLNIMVEVLPRTPTQDSMHVQRKCITAYPRLINYGEGFDDIIDMNGAEKNSLPTEANERMEEHYKRMYNDAIKVVDVLDALRRYKHSRDPMDQDVFACMIHGLFDEYSLYSTYPLEALKTTALLFGGIIRYKLLPDLPLEIALGMIYDAVKDSPTEEPMYKFGLQALTQTLDHFDGWPGLCRQLLQIPQLRGTESFARAEQVVREADAEAAHLGNGINGDGAPNGSLEEAAPTTKPSFKSIHADPPRQGDYEEPSEDVQEKVLFVLNNITNDNLESKFAELKSAMENRYQTWFAGHLVEARAKMQPNYHQLYLHLVRQFADKTLWAEILRETFVSVVRMLNAETTATMASERVHLKNLGDWLGSITLARDKPIKHKNIAFKQLLHEGYHSQRLIFVLPFVCKVLSKAEGSAIFTESNPWLLDVLRCLKELYETDLKLNLKFEIEVLLKDYLRIPIDSIEPWAELQISMPALDEPSETLQLDVVDRFDRLSVNGMGSNFNSGRFSPIDITSTLPELGNLLTYPPANDMVDQGQLRQIVQSAITRAVHEIIAPVVERSVTIAAISTSNMIHKDFVTEPDENRVKEAAIRMVKRTAGALALVTSKEPLRASMSNYIRQLSQNLPNGLPEGTIIISVNANLDLACSLVEKKAEERAVPEIESMIEEELNVRREHRLRGSREPYYDRDALSRWAMTISAPYKLLPNGSGLNPEQMAIYDEFAKHRLAVPTVPVHGQTSSDASRSMANDILQDGYASGVQMPSANDNSSIQHLAMQQQSYAPTPAPQTNGRAAPMDADVLSQKINELLDNIVITATNTTEEHMEDIPSSLGGHPMLTLIDSLLSLLIRSLQIGGPDAIRWALDQATIRLFSNTEDSLAIEALARIQCEIVRLAPALHRVLVSSINNQPDERLLNVPIAMTLMGLDLLEWQRIDSAASKELLQHSESALEFISSLMHKVLLTDRPTALRTDFARSLEAIAQWLREEPTLQPAQQLIEDLSAHGMPQGLEQIPGAAFDIRREQVEYTFDEWNHLCLNSNATDVPFAAFIDQLHNKQIINDVDSTCLFFRICIDKSVFLYEREVDEMAFPSPDVHYHTDALAKLIVWLVKQQGQRSGEVQQDKASYLNSIISFVVLVLNHHYVMRGENFNQRVFFRLFSTMLTEFTRYSVEMTISERHEILSVFADTFFMLGPDRFPGFIFAWVSLVSHRDFMAEFMKVTPMASWEPMVKIHESLLKFVGEMTKQLQPPLMTPHLYTAAAKVLMAINHDWPEFLAANHMRFCHAIPLACTQLQNLILTANPSPSSPDVLQPGLKIDRLDEMRQSPPLADASFIEAILREANLLDLIDQALQSGPSEDAVAHIAHAIQRKRGYQTTAGNVPVNVDTKLIDAIVLHVGIHSIEKANVKQGASFVSASPDAALLIMLVHELSPEARYYFLNSIVNQLRYANSHTHYFSQALLEIFGNDMNDPEDLEIRQQIVRIILERSIGQWPQPWGLVLLIVELVKNEKYMFFELPFIKAERDIAERFNALAQRPL